MRREDTPSFLHEFLHVRFAPLLDSFRDWAMAQRGIIDASYASADHFSYKCREVREYDALRARFEECSDGWRGCRFFHQSIISGRRVAIIGLTESFYTPLGDLRYLELAEPKPMSAGMDGFDHVEIYSNRNDLPGWAKLDDLSSRLNGRSTTHFTRKDRPHHATWDALVPADGAPGRQDFIIRLTDEPIVAKIAREML